MSSKPKVQDRKAATRFLVKRPLLWISLLYFLSTLVVGPLDPRAASPDWHWKLGPIYWGRPVVTSGDSPHYLTILSSLVEDFDLYLENNHAQTKRRAWDAGTRQRARGIGGHVDLDSNGRKLSFHPFYRMSLLAPLVYPARGTEWVESLSIWFTMLGALLGLARLGQVGPVQDRWLLMLALGTPLWAYSRDLWSEPWMMVTWILLLTEKRALSAGLASVLGALFKPSFAVVPWTLAVIRFRQGRRREAWILASAGTLAVLLAIGVAQWIYRDVDHFSLFHIGERHLPGQIPFQIPGLNVLWGALGLLFDPNSGLLPFAPFLAWGLVTALGDLAVLWRKRSEFLKPRTLQPTTELSAQLEKACWTLPGIAYFLLHASYAGWHGGAGFSARFLVPMLPVFIYWTMRSRPQGKLFSFAVAYSLLFSFLAGVLPIIAFDRTPWDFLHVLATELWQFLF